MVEGIEKFINNFKSYQGAFVVIGGTACAAVLEEAGLPFRTTKDIDIVLIAEALDENFMTAFWDFIHEGHYSIRESVEGKKILYRFEKPQSQGFPSCLELFSRIPLKDRHSRGHKLRIQAPGTRLYLSAIFMEDDYYKFIGEGIQKIAGIPIADAIHLIPLKAKAWLEMNARRTAGEKIDSRDIEKHRKDILRLFVLIDPGTKLRIPEIIQADLAEFIAKGFKNWKPDMRSLGLGDIGLDEVAQGLRAVYFP